jgi:hypothetical protein
MTEPNTGRFATTNLGVGDDSLIESTFTPNSKVLIKEHQVDFETLTGFEAENKYTLQNNVNTFTDILYRSKTDTKLWHSKNQLLCIDGAWVLHDRLNYTSFSKYDHSFI